MLDREAISRPKDRGCEPQVRTGVEGLLDGDTQPREIGRVHLRQPDIDGVAGRHVPAHQRGTVSDRRGADTRPLVDIDRQIVAAAFGHDEGNNRLGRDLRRALLRKHGDRGDGVDHCCVTVW